MNKISLNIVATMVATSISAACAAQQAEVDEVIVTSSRAPESLDEVPASVSVITSETLHQDMQLTTELQNILSTRVPGMAPATGSSSNFGVTLRGRQALVLIDGVPQSTPLRNGQLDQRSIDPAALERIEVVKGATSIYGNGASGGIINYITRRPPSEDGIGGEVQTSARFSLIDTSDSLGARTAALVSGRSEKIGYVINVAAENRGVDRDADGDIPGNSLYGLSDVDTRNFFGKLAYDFDAEKALQLTYTYYDSQQKSDLVDVVGDVNTRTKTYAVHSDSGTPGVPQGADGNHNAVLQYRDTQLFTNTGLVMDVYWQETRNVFFWSTNFANPAEGYSGGNSIIESEKRGVRANFDTAFDWKGIDMTFIYGLDVLEDITSQPLADGRTWVPDMDMTNMAGYLQGKWSVANWIFKAGLRRELIDVEVPDYTTLRQCNSSGLCVGGNPVEGGELDYANTTYNAGLRYNLHETFQPFVSYSEGFDVSDLGVLLRAATVPNLSQVETEAAIVEHWEAGFSGQVGEFNYEFALYRSDSELSTQTVESPPGSGFYAPARAPERIEGYELSLGYRFNEALDGGVTYSYVEGENPDTGAYLDARRISPPKFTAWLDWEPTAATRLSINYLHVDNRSRFERINGRYTGAEAPVHAYDVVNLSGSYRYAAWEFTAGIENLLNEDYYTARAQAFTYAGYNSKAIGRTAVLGATYRF